MRFVYFTSRQHRENRNCTSPPVRIRIQWRVTSSDFPTVSGQPLSVTAVPTSSCLAVAMAAAERLSAAGPTLLGLLSRGLEVIVGGEVLEEVTLLLHDAVELVGVNSTIAITIGLVDHVLELLIVDGLTELLSHTGEVLEGDLGGAIIVEHLEHLLDILAGVLLAHLAGHHAKELLELDVAVVVDVGDHLLELLVLDFEAEGTHGGLGLTHIDGTGSVGVKEGERFADLLDLLVAKSSFLLPGAAHVDCFVTTIESPC